MRNYDPYKRTILFFASIINILLMSVAFAYAWYNYYSETMYLVRFYRRCHYLMIALFFLLLFFFSNTYNGLKIGQHRQIEILLFQYLIILLIYGDRSVLDLIYKAESRSDKYAIYDAIHIEEGMEKITEKMKDFQAVIIIDISAVERNNLLKYCYMNKVRAYVIPKISDIILIGADRIHIIDTQFLLSSGYTLSFVERFIKRAVDIILAGLLLILTSPVMLATTVCIKLYDHGMDLYHQPRCTKYGRQFEIYKFRSMIVDAEQDGGAVLAKEDDARITPVGKVIRGIRIDELPQLFNVIKGDMSFVGPRPERPEIMEEYCAEM